MVTHAVEDYLTMIYKLAYEGGEPTTTSIADNMGVSKASVTDMFKKMAKSKLIIHEPYKGVKLTRAGEKVALEVIRHHRLVELYLKEAMGVSWDKVHDEADKWEHILSEDIEDRIVEMLGNPTHDPHGAPIPTKDGHIQDEKFTPLSDAREGEKLLVRLVEDSDPEKLRYLAEKGIYPQTVIEVKEVQPFEGPLTLDVEGSPQIIGHEVSRIVFVSKMD